MTATCAPEVPNETAGRIVCGPEGLTITAIEPQEVDLIARFYAGFEGEHRPLEFWRERLRLWWEGNPAFHQGWHRGVKMTAGGRVVGVLSAVPVHTRSGGRPAIGAALTTWRVEKDWRAGSIGMFEAVLQAHARNPVFNGTPTESVTRLLTHYGFSRPRTFFPASRMLCNGWRLLARACGGRASSLASPVFYVNDRLAVREEAASLVDELWSAHLPEMENMGVKDGAYFGWYCRPGRTNGRLGFVITDPAGRPVGMGICLDMGRGVAWLVDMWCDFSDAAIVSQVVSAARSHVSRQGFHCLWVPHFHPALAAACGPRRPVRKLPVSAFIKQPSPVAADSSSYWTIAIGDFGI